MAATVKIGGRDIGPGKPAYIVAEMSANHHQCFDQAVAILRAARDCGADAVKLQTYTADTLTIRCEREPFRIGAGTLWSGRYLYDLYAEAHTPWEWQPKLKTLAGELGLDLFSTPFDDTAVDFLEAMGVPAHKIASFELVDLALVRRVARTGKPILMSTGMATLGEIEEAVETAREAGNTQLVLLKCTSAYPAAPHEMNLRTIPHMAKAFGVPAGLSDHTLGIAAPVAAVALGACVIEKHLCLSRGEPGPDSAFSLEPAEFGEMVRAIRAAEQSLGTVQYHVSEREARSRVFRRSLFVVEDVRAGEALTPRNVRSIRPGHGLAPKYLPLVLRSLAAVDIARGTPLAWSHLNSRGDSE